jgi:hypothetical protein
VPSRTTSLLVLESEAMFKAFGIDRTARGAAWTGEAASVGSVVESLDSDAPDVDLSMESRLGNVADKKANAYDDGLGALGASGAGNGGGGFAAGPAAGRAASLPKSAAAAQPDDLLARDNNGPPPPAPAAAASRDEESPAPAATASPSHGAAESATEGSRRRWPPSEPANPFNNRFRTLRPMKRIWTRKATIVEGASPAVTDEKIAAARTALAAAPDARSKHKDLVRLLALSGRLDELSDELDKWSARDPLDGDCIAARADLAARRGDRRAAMRVLGGVLAQSSASPADLAAVATSLADAHEREGEASVACAYRITAAELRPTDAKTVARAVRCEGRGDAGRARWTDPMKEADRRALAAELAKSPPALDVGQTPSGDIVVSATWDAPQQDRADLDVALIDPNGNRVAWVGRGKGVRVDGAKATGREALGISTSAAGPFVVEITRSSGLTGASGTIAAPIAGRVTIRALGSSQTMPFFLAGARAQVARIDVHFEPQLVPFDGPIDQLEQPGTGPFDAARARAIVGNVLTTAQTTCRQAEGPFGTGTVNVTFEPSGRVSNATMGGADLRGSLVAGCALARVRFLRVPPFSGATPVTVAFPFTVSQ